MDSDEDDPRIKNILLDINGVLFDSGCEGPISGSVDAISRLEKRFNICLVTNECTTAKRLLARKLNNFGYTSIKPETIVSPAPVACEYIKKHNLIPRLHIWDGVMEDFDGILRPGSEKSTEQPNCIVIGDIMSKLSNDYMDESLELMLNSQRKPEIISLGTGRYYKDGNKLRMDTGCYTAAFEFALGVKAVNLGKPSPLLFELALERLGALASETVMIGDDIVSDVGGAQALGMRGILVRTGKYKPIDEKHERIKADSVFDNLQAAADHLLEIFQ